MYDHENTHKLSPTAEAILGEMVNYHRTRLHAFDERVYRRQQAEKLAATKGIPSIARAILSMSAGRLREEAPLEHEYFRRVDGDPQRIVIPFGEFRDLSKGAAAAGGYLVGVETRDPTDILRPWSVTARAGIEVESGLVGDQAIPKITVKSAPAWLSAENSTVTPSQPTLGQIAAQPKTIGCVINFSRQLAKQANAETFVRRELIRTVATALDQAVMSGTGASGQPLGLLNTTGINSVSGTSLAHSGVANMKRLVADANAPAETNAFLGTPAVRELLEARERATGNGFVWDSDRVAGRPAFASTDVPATTLICGAWPTVFLGIWGAGFTVEVNPFDVTGFKTGVIQARILLSCDVVIRHPAAFCKAGTIT